MFPMHGYGYGGGGGVALVLMALVFLVLAGGAAALIVTAVSSPRPARPLQAAVRAGSAEEAVRQRFGRGEIDLDEMKRLLTALRASRTG
jgi:uncharacterized membrane protein